MKTVIDSSNVNFLIVGEFYEQPQRAKEADMNTPFDEKFDWIDKKARIAKAKTIVQGVEVIVGNPKKPNNPTSVKLSSFQVMYIAQWYNNNHDQFCDPVEVGYDD